MDVGIGNLGINKMLIVEEISNIPIDITKWVVVILVTLILGCTKELWVWSRYRNNDHEYNHVKILNVKN